MKPIKDNRQPEDRMDERLLDRLVDGELPDEERRELLVQLENQPDGWRRCALAFLEAQTWQQALIAMAAPAAAVQWPRPMSSLRRRILWHPVARLTALAAGLLLAFALGWAYHRGPEQPVASSDANGRPGAVAQRSIQPTEEALGKVATAPSTPKKPAEATGSIDPIVRNLQQRGYSVETQQRVVSMESKDGRKVKLPVQEVRIRYTGDRIY